MLNSFWVSFQLKNTYRVNSIIYALKQIPLIKKILPDDLYQNTGIKILGNIISGLIELYTIFIGKLLYVATMIFGMVYVYENQMDQANLFIHIFTFLTFAGALLNTYMFNPTNDKYYAMFIMRMDAKKYTLSNYMYALAKVVIGFMPWTILFGLLVHAPLYVCLLFPFFIASCKILMSSYYLLVYQKKKKIRDENHPVKAIWLVLFLFLLLAYALPYVQIAITPMIFLVLAIITILLSLLGLRYIKNYNLYREIYKEILTETNMKVASYDNKDVVKESVLKQIDVDQSVTSKKEGYRYFNDLFMKRHNKILLKSSKKIAVFALFCILGVIAVSLVNEPMKVTINQAMLQILPIFVFGMYMINRGQTITQAMFMNCDHSMLTYAFYRSPKVIVLLFKERLKSIILINLLPASVIAVGLPLILYVTGGTSNTIEYAILFFSIIAMSIFFSVHYLVLYYLLQPYNEQSEMKSATYSIANVGTYMVCYYMLKLQLPTLTFGAVLVIFSILYCVISLFLAYRLAPKTFKIRS